MAKPSVFDELYPSRFLKAGLLKGAKVTLTIKDVDIEMLLGEDGKENAKAILSFVERPMQHVMPKTNAICIKALFGANLSDWKGKRITLFEGTWNNEPCIRVWGSPDIAKDMTIQVQLPRRKPFSMVLHATKIGIAQKPATAPKHAPGEVDPRIATAWDLLGWKESEGQEDYAQFEGDEAAYVVHLNALLDEPVEA